jgi:hypothetical protein
MRSRRSRERSTGIAVRGERSLERFTGIAKRSERTRVRLGRGCEGSKRAGERPGDARERLDASPLVFSLAGAILKVCPTILNLNRAAFRFIREHFRRY